jgi:hypothetical protein
MSYGAVAGAFGGVNVTLTKTVFSLIVGQYDRGGIAGILSSGVLWATSIALIATYLLQIIVTVSGLEATSAIIVISAHSVTEEIMATLGGILYFQDYLKFESWSWAMFIIGNMTAVFSVIGLSHLRLRDAEAKERQQAMIAAVAADADTPDGSETEYSMSVDPEQNVYRIRKRTSTAGSAGLHFGDEDPEIIKKEILSPSRSCIF